MRASVYIGEYTYKLYNTHAPPVSGIWLSRVNALILFDISIFIMFKTHYPWGIVLITVFAKVCCVRKIQC
jgi:hypothetical protein